MLRKTISFYNFFFNAPYLVKLFKNNEKIGNINQLKQTLFSARSQQAVELNKSITCLKFLRWNATAISCNISLQSTAISSSLLKRRPSAFITRFGLETSTMRLRAFTTHSLILFFFSPSKSK